MANLTSISSTAYMNTVMVVGKSLPKNNSLITNNLRLKEITSIVIGTGALESDVETINTALADLEHISHGKKQIIKMEDPKLQYTITSLQKKYDDLREKYATAMLSVVDILQIIRKSPDIENYLEKVGRRHVTDLMKILDGMQEEIALFKSELEEELFKHHYEWKKLYFDLSEDERRSIPKSQVPGDVIRKITSGNKVAPGNGTHHNSTLTEKRTERPRGNSPAN